MRTIFCGNSSVGRARPCQGRGREFESRFPLQFSLILMKLRRDSKMVMPRIANPLTPVRFRLAPPRFQRSSSVPRVPVPCLPICPGGGIGRHRRLKISRPYGRTGSIPVPGTSIIKACSDSACKLRTNLKNPDIPQSENLNGTAWVFVQLCDVCGPVLFFVVRIRDEIQR
jgi:hypothetical protein